MLSRPLTLAIVSALLACSTPTGSNPIEGQWGGSQASLALTESGGTLAYACGAGTIDSAWTLSRDGRLSGTGQHFFGGGPAPVLGHPPHPARYLGIVRGRTLTLTVVLLDLPDTLGPFAMKRDGPPVSELCL